MLDELLLGGEVQETSKKNVLKAIAAQDLLQEVSTDGNMPFSPNTCRLHGNSQTNRFWSVTQWTQATSQFKRSLNSLLELLKSLFSDEASSYEAISLSIFEFRHFLLLSSFMNN